MSVEICTVYAGVNGLDDDYTFFEDGTIKRFYDRNPHRLNLTEYLKPSDIRGSKLERIIANCPKEHLDKIKKILNLS
ncbi:hypothetical protein EZ456_23790 [Pedobacter psychrodurus]|uniref:Uncharacterized protein n=1 Tax=Pedobacter psychrodurus TaxID=2530456 RepID=A0A4R0PNS0_9SPHI|nr:hypothetical protein [Pedobacter psychrodurus]TCD16974.1 hypothetical protein EZ456_23790 [Pedobacter psychrodurus]